MTTTLSRSGAVTACAVAVLVLAACGSSKTAPANSSAAPAPSEEPKACATSEDCALVSACCGCNAGGRQIAIRKDAVAAFEASQEQRCAGNMCAQVISTDPSCSAEAICGAQGTCEVAPHMQHD